MRQYNVNICELLQIKREKDENIHSPLDKRMKAMKKQTTDSETLITSKYMLNLVGSEGNPNKAMRS